MRAGGGYSRAIFSRGHTLRRVADRWMVERSRQPENGLLRKSAFGIHVGRSTWSI